ncbi:hypothetical protein G7048_19075 [Diaphorobacter sp. HDW4B]|uniref:hypothetical protein n=1 Tax=Diaphorobacter sp. HDW4B TaxID=2714925 RepID=UPI00140A635C|nr:hypothetical protein [Diaphorobacter sp. HDW4B]QIL72270.1 hypothetical protein G7048_19075 [Diaphorobacter sp. HDW4B]
MKHIGWLVETSEGPMLLLLSDHAEALTYCEDGARPVKLYVDEAELADHEAAQEDSA